MLNPKQPLTLPVGKRLTRQQRLQARQQQAPTQQWASLLRLAQSHSPSHRQH